MKTTDIYAYIGVFLIPSILLLILAAYIAMRSFYRKDGKLLFLAVSSFSLICYLEFIRHISPISYSPFITQNLIGPVSILALTFTLHLTYTLATLKKEFSFPFMPYILYSPVVFHIIISNFMILHENDFYKYNLWIQRDHLGYDIWIFSIIGIVIACSIYVLFKGYKKATDPVRKRLLNFLMQGTILLSILFILMITVFNEDYLPPVPTVFLGVSTALLITIGMVKFNLSPSKAERYRIMFDMSPTALMVLNENMQIIEMNKRAKQTFPKNSNQTIAGLFNTPFNQKQAMLVLQKLIKVGSLDDYTLEFEDPLLKTKRIFSVMGSTVRFADETHYYIKWRDISEDLEKEKLIEHLAYYDSLTNIYNRTYFVPNASKIIQNYVMSDDTVALILLDLNFFKMINDTYGHAVGDLVLIKTANILKSALPEYKTIIARLGGDEFVVLVEGLPNREHVHTVIEKIRYKFSQSPFENHKFHITISPSIGYALAPFESIHLDDLIQIADRRMYEDKVRIKEAHNN